MVGYTVVVADDEQQVLSALSQLLTSAGHTVVGKAATGEEAMWLCQTLKPDVLLLDIQMPGVNGLDAAKRLMESSPMPIVMCTGHYDDELINAASRIGVYAYVVKPCRLANLLPAINLAISRFQEARLLRNEVDSLKEALSTRKVVEQAKGIIMRTRGLPEESAHKFLQQESQRQSRSLGELAKAIVVAHESLTPKIYGQTRAN